MKAAPLLTPGFRWEVSSYMAMPCPTSVHCPASRCLWHAETSEPAPFWEKGHVTTFHQGHRNCLWEKHNYFTQPERWWVLWDSMGHSHKAPRRRLGWMMVSGVVEQAKHQWFRLVKRGSPFWEPASLGLSLPSLRCPFTSFSGPLSAFQCPALCPLYPNIYYQIEGGW